jgi:molybdopterin-guanine dinucleotide biosynthesis protein A
VTGAEPYDAVVLAGGEGRRLDGADKALLRVGGRTLLDRMLAAVTGAATVAVVGPPREVAAPMAITWCREEPPGGGPVPAVAAGLEVGRAPVVVVLAVDHPFVERATVDALTAAVGARDGAHGVGEDGRAQPLVAAYRRSSLAEALARSARLSGLRLRDVLAPLDLAAVPVGAAATDCDTWADLTAAEAADPPGAAATRMDP